MRPMLRNALAFALAALPVSFSVAEEGASAGTERGAKVYATHCLACHQVDGAGVQGFQPGLVDAPLVVGDESELIRFVIYGERPADAPGGEWIGAMAQFGFLSNEDLAAVLTYIRSQWGGGAGAVTEAQVMRERSDPPGSQ